MIISKKVWFIFLLCHAHLIYSQNQYYFKQLQNKKVNSTPNVEWTVIGPGNSGYSEDLFIHPTDSKTMFLNYDMGNSYRTTNKSKSWFTLNDYDGAGSQIRPNWISFSRQDPFFGVMLNKGKIEFTKDKGKTWQWVTNFPSTQRHSVIEIDPNNKNIWYVGAGQYWKVKDIHRSLKHPHGNKKSNTAYGYIFKTTNAGRTWKKILTKVSENLDVGKIIIDPRNSNHIYALTNYGLYFSSNAGKSWSSFDRGLPYNDVRDLCSYYNKNSNEFFLYCVLQTHYQIKNETTKFEGGIFKTTFDGKHWKNITGNLNYNLTATNHPQKKWTYYRTMSHWFGKSLNEIRKLAPIYPSQTLPVFNRIVVSPKNPNEIYVSNNIKHDFSFGPSELLRSLDGGKTWITALRVGNYWKEKKDSNYWKSINNPLGTNASFSHLQEVNNKDGTIGVRLMQMNPDGEIIICYEQQHLISKNHGVSWEQIDDFETTPGSNNWVGSGNSNLPGFGLNLNTNEKGKYLFFTEEHGIWKSTLDGNKVATGATALRQIEGQSVDPESNSTSITALTIDPNNPKVYYTLTNRQKNAGCFRKSEDGGNTWKTLSKPIPNMKSNNLLYLFSIVINKHQPNHILFCVPSQTERGWHPSKWVKNNRKYSEFSDYGVYKSTDGGRTWSNKNKGLPNNLNVTYLTYDKNYETLYAALATSTDNAAGGLYKSVNNGQSWKKMKLPIGVTSVKHIEFDNYGLMYIATGDGRTKAGFGGVYRSRNKGKDWQRIFNMPNTNKVVVSKLDPNYIGVVVAPNRRIKYLNPGIYLSFDKGKNWHKSNRGLGQPDKIEGFDFDPFDKNIFWSVSHGSGFAKGILKKK